MQALKLTIPGDYWDVHIYRGQMYLWRMNGSILTLSWSDLVDEIGKKARSSFATRFGFAEGSALYSRGVWPLFREDQFSKWAAENFANQSLQVINVEARELQRATIDEQESPFCDLAVDSEIYDRTLYVTGKSGLWRASIGRGTRRPVSSRAYHVHDIPAVSIAARGRKLALAASGDGLFQHSIDWTQGTRTDPTRISDRHCEQAFWAFQSVFASSTLESSYFVARYWGDHFDESSGDWDDSRLVNAGLLETREIPGTLSDAKYGWAFEEKIYTTDGLRLSSTRYRQSDLAFGISAASKTLGGLELGNPEIEPCAAGSATFGVVVEHEDGLSIVESDDVQSEIAGPITKWRTYPRAINYENHLHVIKDDFVEIHAFYGDFFADPDAKRFGAKFDPNRRGLYFSKS